MLTYDQKEENWWNASLSAYMQAVIFKKIILISKEMIPYHSHLEKFMLNLVAGCHTVQFCHFGFCHIPLLSWKNKLVLWWKLISWVHKCLMYYLLLLTPLSNFLLHVIRQRLTLIMKCLFGTMPAWMSWNPIQWYVCRSKWLNDWQPIIDLRKNMIQTYDIGNALTTKWCITSETATFWWQRTIVLLDWNTWPPQTKFGRMMNICW